MNNARAQELTVHFKTKGYLYDIRNNRYLGEGEKFQVKIAPLVPGIYALLPGSIKEVKAATAAKVTRGQAVKVHFRIEGGGALFYSLLQIFMFIILQEKRLIYTAIIAQL